MAADRLTADRHTLDRSQALARPDAHLDLVQQLVVRRIAEDVVRDHDELSLTGAVAPIADDGVMVGELVARVSGFGPLQPFLDDPEVEEVWINDPSRVFIARRGRHELTNLRLDAAQVNELVEDAQVPRATDSTSCSKASPAPCPKRVAGVRAVGSVSRLEVEVYCHKRFGLVRLGQEFPVGLMIHP